MILYDSCYNVNNQRADVYCMAFCMMIQYMKLPCMIVVGDMNTLKCSQIQCTSYMYNTCTCMHLLH